MLKRLVGVVVIKDGWAVQSMGYSNYLPLGRPEIVVENYDRWQLDEILVVDIDSSKFDSGPNFDLLRKISSRKIMTPLCYMGGIRNVDDALELVKMGADRLAIDSLFRRDHSAARSISEAIGRQAVVRVQPLLYIDSEVFIYDHLSKKAIDKLDPQDFMDDRGSFSELMLVDVKNEGSLDSFCKELISPFLNKNIQLICFGGITTQKQINSLYEQDEISAVAIGNSLNYLEIPHKILLVQNEVDLVRTSSFGAVTKGAREW